MDTTEAKAVLAEVPETEQAYRFRAALAAMIAEVERLTAPLDADEIDGAPVRRELTRLRTPSLLIGDSEKAAIAAFIETLAAQLAAKDAELAFYKACEDSIDEDAPLTEAEQAKIDAAWEKHKAAAPTQLAALSGQQEGE